MSDNSDREVHEPSARSQQRGDPVDQHEMAEMVAAELGFESVGSVAERTSLDRQTRAHTLIDILIEGVRVR